MAKIEGGHLVARTLKAHGVEYLFTLCGGTIESIYDGCLNEGIRIVDVRIDHSAPLMADAYVRVSGKLGVSAVTRGPGHAASFYGLVTAHVAGTPMLAISGFSDIAEIDMASLQEYDIAGTVRPVTKWSKLVGQTHRLPEYINAAVRHAWAGRPGPAHLSLPNDVLYQSIEDDNIAVPTAESTRPTARIRGDTDLIERAIKMLSEAHRPVVIAGAGARWSNAGKALMQFIETTHLPLFAKQSDVNVIYAPHPLFFGRATTRFPSATTQLQYADVVLSLGCRLDWMLNFGRPPLFAKDAKFIMVDVDSTMIGFNRPFELGIVGDVRSVVEDMTATATRYDFAPRRDWLNQLKQANQAFDAKVMEAANGNGTPVHPLCLCKAVREFYGDDATIVLDGGDITLFGYMAFNHYHPPHFLFTGPLGGIGQGTAFAMAGKLARPDKPAVLLSGDGAMGYGIMEYDTAFKHRLPFVSIVSNNAAWGLIRHPQIKRYGIERAVATDLRDNMPYHKIVEAMGGYGEHVEKPKDLYPALERAQRAVEKGVPAMINVKTQLANSINFAHSLNFAR